MDVPAGDVRAKVLARIGRGALVLYDGQCGFCQACVQFIFARDDRRYFYFAPLQAAWVRDWLGTRLQESVGLDSVCLFDGQYLYTKSDAALRIAGNLQGFWKLMTLLRIIPRFLRNPIYDFVARRRQLISARIHCQLPSKELSQRLLGDEFDDR